MQQRPLMHISYAKTTALEKKAAARKKKAPQKALS
ncbi:hypothetical protein FHS76_002197 [Ochrobactrum daejeonense]|uniref:Uncharacterized protein n=1 Tax=Brucella daejeonensis TaxID=659015 RepID=A0A7W9AY10_9HYPH|nr:hypothetical protein [Brucella daejeonensis]